MTSKYHAELRVWFFGWWESRDVNFYHDRDSREILTCSQDVELHVILPSLPFSLTWDRSYSFSSLRTAGDNAQMMRLVRQLDFEAWEYHIDDLGHLSIPRRAPQLLCSILVHLNGIFISKLSFVQLLFFSYSSSPYIPLKALASNFRPSRSGSTITCTKPLYHTHELSRFSSHPSSYLRPKSYCVAHLYIMNSDKITVLLAHQHVPN